MSDTHRRAKQIARDGFPAAWVSTFRTTVFRCKRYDLGKEKRINHASRTEAARKDGGTRRTRSFMVEDVCEYTSFSGNGRGT